MSDEEKNKAMKDEAVKDEHVKGEEIVEHVKDTSAWTRLLFMALFAVLYWVAEVVLAVVILFQFLSVLFTGNRNDKVLSLGAQLSTYAYQIFRYLTYNSEERPFPMGDWPSDAELEAAKSARKAATTRKRAPAKKKAAATVKKEAGAEEEKPASSD